MILVPLFLWVCWAGGYAVSLVRPRQTRGERADADAAAFVNAAVRLTEDVALRGCIGRQARAHVAALDWQAVVERFAEVLTGTGVVTGGNWRDQGNVGLRFAKDADPD